MPTPQENRQISSGPEVPSPGAKVTPPPLEKYVEQGLSHFSNSIQQSVTGCSDKQAQDSATLLRYYAEQLPPKERIDFITQSLPFLAEHISKHEKLNYSQLKAFLEFGTRSNAILYFLPEALRMKEFKIPVLNFRLEKLSDAVPMGRLNSLFKNRAFTFATRNNLLRKVDTDRLLTLLARAGDRADSLMGALFSLQEATQHRLPFTMLLSIFDEASRKHGLRKSLGASKVCYLILTTVSPPENDYDYYRLVLHSLGTSIKWPEEDTEHNLYHLGQIIKRLPEAPDQYWFNSLLTSLNAVHPSDAPQILKLTSEHANFSDTETYTTYLKFIQEWHEQVDKKNLWQFLKYSAGGFSTGRMDMYKNIMSNLHRAFGSMHRTSRYLSRLDEVMKRMNDQEIATLDDLSYRIDERIDRYIDNDIPESKDILDYVVCLILAEGHESPWQSSIDTFENRYDEKHDAELVPVYSYERSETRVRVCSKLGSRGRYIEHPRKANFAFTLSCARRYKAGTPVMRENAFLSITEDLGLQIPDLSAKHPESFLDLIHLASRTDDGEPFQKVVQKSYPYLAEATHTHLPPVDELSVRDARGYHFLESLRVLIDDRLPVTFERLGMERTFIDRLKDLANLKQIEAELRKYKSAPPDATWTITFSTSKNFLDACYDLLSETCIPETCGDDFYTPEFQPLRMTVKPERWLIGNFLTAISPIKKKRNLVLLGGGPQAAAFERMDPEEFALALRRECEEICRQQNLHDYCFAVGAPSKNKPFTDEGRIAQFPSLRKALVPLDSTIIELSEEEYIHIPKDYNKGPVTRVAMS